MEQREEREKGKKQGKRENGEKKERERGGRKGKGKRKRRKTMQEGGKEGSEQAYFNAKTIKFNLLT